MSGWYQKGNNNGSWSSGWNKGGWRPKGSGKGSTQTPITDLVTSLQSSMKEQQLLQALAPALLSGTMPAMLQTAPTPAAPAPSQSSIPDELKTVLSGLKESIDTMTKTHATATPPLAWTPAPHQPPQPTYKPHPHQDAEVQMLKQELGDFRESLRQLQQTHPIGQLQQQNTYNSHLTPPPRKRSHDDHDSADTQNSLKLPCPAKPPLHPGKTTPSSFAKTPTNASWLKSLSSQEYAAMVTCPLTNGARSTSPASRQKT